MKRALLTVLELPVLVLALALCAAPALAQHAEKQDGRRPQQQMSQEERQRMRNDMRDVYRDRGAAERSRPERPRPMTPAEREKLRRDIQDANRDLRR